MWYTVVGSDPAQEVDNLKKYNITQPVAFKKGSYDLNRNPYLNFELNRAVNWNGVDPEELRKVSHEIQNFDDWKKALLALGKKAKDAGNIESSIGCYRMAEFFMDPDDPDTEKCYLYARSFFDHYYADYFKSVNGRRPVIEKYQVPYEDTTLPVMKAVPENENEIKGTILLLGGYNFCFEEFLFPMLYLCRNGYTVYLFEGPGQGEMLRLKKKYMITEWEKPVMALTGFFDLHNAAVIGVSLGGYYAPRAAAFDSRITRVVEWTAFPSLWDIVRTISGEPGVIVLHLLASTGLGEKLLDRIKRKASDGNIAAVSALEVLRRTDIRTFKKFCAFADQLDIRKFADKITQDVLILHGDHDVFCDPKMVSIAEKLQKNARSMTTRILTNGNDAAGDHCSCENTKQALDLILEWLEAHPGET